MCQEELLQVGRATINIQKPQVKNVSLPKARSYLGDHSIHMCLRELRSYYPIKGVVPDSGDDPLNLIRHLRFGKLRGSQVGQHFDHIDGFKQWPTLTTYCLLVFIHDSSLLFPIPGMI